MIEVTINDSITFSSIGLGLIKHDIPILPPTKDYSVEIAGKDGEIDFGSVYGARVINLECVLMADDPTADYQAKVAALASVFNAKKGNMAFVFSDQPNKRYMARYAGTMSIEKLIFDGNVTIPLKMHNPYSESLRDTSVPEYDDGLEYGQGYEYSSYAFGVSVSPTTAVIENLGTVEAAPVIRIEGAFTDLSISDGTNTFIYTGTNISTDVLEVDCEKFKVLKNGTNAYANSNGVFFLLELGQTSFTITATTANIRIVFVFRHKYLY